MSTAACRIVVSGRVQGVGFRAWTRDEANKLHLRGSAENLLDGRVEIHVEGETDAVDSLLALLQGGTAPGSVSSVDVHPVEARGADGFTTG